MRVVCARVLGVAAEETEMTCLTCPHYKHGCVHPLSDRDRDAEDVTACDFHPAEIEARRRVMDKAFRYQTKNRWGDYVGAEISDRDFLVTVGDRIDRGRARLTRSDLTAIIEKLTALRDGVVS